MKKKYGFNGGFRRQLLGVKGRGGGVTNKTLQVLWGLYL